jgi:phenylacetic acid degradation operon negative regulatory protein
MLLKASLKKKILLFLAASWDFWYENFSYTAIRKGSYFKHWRKTTLLNEVSRLTSVGDIEKVVKNDKVYLRLTSSGNEKLKQDIPFFRFSDKSWDGYWRIVIFDIPEERKSLRKALRYKLKELGLGQWQRSVYITPFDLEEEINQFLKANEVFGMAFCIKGKRLGGGDDKEIARHAFKLDQLDQEYEYFIDEETSNTIIKINENKLQEEDINNYIDNYLRLILKDPGLPKDLLPDGWYVSLAKEEYRKTLQKIKKFLKEKRDK